MFQSRVNRGSDYGYISYKDSNYGGGERARLTIGTSNDADDDLILQPTGDVGINNDNPEEKLHVSGNIKASGFVEADYVNTDTVRWGGSGYASYKYEGFLSSTYKRLVGQRFCGMVVFSPVSNDDSGAVFHVAENSNSGNGSIVTTRRMTNYYNSGIYINYRWSGGYLEFYGRNMSSYQYYRISIFGNIV